MFLIGCCVGLTLAPSAPAQEGADGQPGNQEESALNPRTDSFERPDPDVGDATFPLFVDEERQADEDGDFYGPRENLFYAGFGAAYWDRLGDLQPRVAFDTSEGFGSFDSWGFGLDLGYQRRVWAADDERTSFWLGG